MAAQYQPQKRRWLYDLTCLLMLLTCVRVWVGSAPVMQSAQAQIPDAGAQRKALVEEARRTNELLTEIKDLLENRTLNVRIQGADNQVPAAPPGAREVPKP